MPSRKTLIRRFQQLFILCAVLGAGTVVACSGADTVFVENHLNYPIQLTLDPIQYQDSEADIEAHIQQFTYHTQTINPGEVVSFVASWAGTGGGPRDWLVRLEDDHGGDWRFWVSKKAVHGVGCVVSIDQPLIDFLNKNPDKTREFKRDKLVVSDKSLLGPVVKPGVCDLSPVSATQTAEAATTP